MIDFCGEIPVGKHSFSFEVPEKTYSVIVSGATGEHGFLYASVYDCAGIFRGRVVLQETGKRLVIGAQEAGPGGIAGAIAEGMWTLELDSMEAASGGKAGMHTHYAVTVTYNETVEPGGDGLTECIRIEGADGAEGTIHFDYETVHNPARRWYRGDLHAHTRLSDGSQSLQEAVATVHAENLEFFFFTEHNICHPRLSSVSSECTCLLLPGVEVTSPEGHFNVHGPQRIMDLRKCHGVADVIAEGIQIASGMSSLSMNHPMMTPWHWQYDALPLDVFSTIEVCCDPTWSSSPEATEGALSVLGALWNAGHRIAPVGGSDSHLLPCEKNPGADAPSVYGDPSTYVFSDGLSGQGILYGLRNGHVYVERSCGLSFQINDGTLLPGQDSQGAPLVYTVAVTDTAQQYYAECIVDGRVVSRYDLSDIPVQITVTGQEYMWCRLDVRKKTKAGRMQGLFEGIVSPVYNGTHPRFSSPVVRTWGELMEKMKNNAL